MLTIIGGGSGTADYLLPAAKSVIGAAQTVCCAERLEPLVPPEKRKPLHIPALLSALDTQPESAETVVLVSGDCLMYSLARTVRQRCPHLPLRLIPGIGSLQLLCAAFSLTMEQAAVCSCHGRMPDMPDLLRTVQTHMLTLFYCDACTTPAVLAQHLTAHGFGSCIFYIGESLGTPAQRLTRRAAADCVQLETGSLCVCGVENPGAVPAAPVLHRDTAFLRSPGVPMTREEVRAVILMKMQLEPDSIVYDIGAGTGSVCIDCEGFLRTGMVYAIEKQAHAFALLCRNIEQLCAFRVMPVQGRAEEVCDTLPPPTHVFIGGSDGGLRVILDRLRRRMQKPVRLVITGVTLETCMELSALAAQTPAAELLTLHIGQARPLGHYHILEQGHPVMLLSMQLGGDR